MRVFVPRHDVLPHETRSGRDTAPIPGSRDRRECGLPDPQVISRKLFTHSQSQPDKCRAGMGLPGASVEAECDCQKAPSFNVLACARQRVGGVERALTPAEVTALGCRPDDRIDKGLVAQDGAPPEFIAGGQAQLASASNTHANKVTGWWDAAQIEINSFTAERIKPGSSQGWVLAKKPPLALSPSMSLRTGLSKGRLRQAQPERFPQCGVLCFS